MAERDGKQLDASGGSEPFRALSGNAIESKAHRAYRDYLDHATGCEICAHTSIHCEAAGALWRAYRGLRR